MKEPYCPVCWADPSRHSDLYCDMLKQEREKYERKLELVREMNRILRRDIDSLEDQGGIIDNLRTNHDQLKIDHEEVTDRMMEAEMELAGIDFVLNGKAPSQTPQEPGNNYFGCEEDLEGPIVNQIRVLKKKADAREADIKDLEEERDEWKQAYEKVKADREVSSSERAHYREVFEDWERVVLNQPVAKRISELCEKVTLRDVQIADLTVERDSFKSMYQSSEAMNAGLLKEHNELKAAYERIACSQPTPAELLTGQMSKLISSMNEAGAAAVRPAPGRLEIAAMVLAGLAADSDLSATREECIEESILMATKLIKADQALTSGNTSKHQPTSRSYSQTASTTHSWA